MAARALARSPGVGLLVLLGTVAPAAAHSTSAGMLDLDLDRGQGVARFTSADLELAGRLRQTEGDPGTLLEQAVRLAAGGQPLRLRAGLPSTEGDRLRVPLRVVGAVGPLAGELALSVDLFRGQAPEHRNLVRVLRGGRSNFRELADGERWKLPTGAASLDAFSAARLGVEHVIVGWDHLLFVAALVLGAARAGLRATALAVSWFTLGHAISLVCAASGGPPAPPEWVEPLIALSIVLAGLQAALPEPAAAGRPREAHSAGYREARCGAFLATACGVAHGLGFAGALADLRLVGWEALAPLLTFNLGIEAAQLAWAAAIVLAAGWLQRKGRSGGLRLAAGGIAAAGALAFLTRI